MPLDKKIFEKNYFFAGLDDVELDALMKISTEKTYLPGEVLIVEAQPPKEVFIILDGEIQITKRAGGQKEEHILTTLKKGDTIGEMGLIDLQPTSASAICTKDAKVIAISISELKALSQPTNILLKIVNNIANCLNQRLRYTNEVTVASLQAELIANQKVSLVLKFFMLIFLALVFYIFSLSIAMKYGSVLASTTLVTVPFLIIFLLLSIYFLKVSQMPMSFFGLTMKNWRYAVFDSLRFTIPALLVLLLFKWVLIEYVPRYSGEALFNPFGALNPQARQTATVWTLVFFASVYSLFSIGQEFLSRGLFQGAMIYFLPDRYKKWGSILLANVAFSAMHMHISMAMAIVVFVPGLLWGWLYSRSQSLVGVSLSHILIGVVGAFVINFSFLLR